MMHGYNLVLFEMPKKVQPRYGWVVILFRKLKYGEAGFCSIENAKIRYGWDFNLFEILK